VLETDFSVALCVYESTLFATGKENELQVLIKIFWLTEELSKLHIEELHLFLLFLWWSNRVGYTRMDMWLVWQRW